MTYPYKNPYFSVEVHLSLAVLMEWIVEIQFLKIKLNFLLGEK